MSQKRLLQNIRNHHFTQTWPCLLHSLVSTTTTTQILVANYFVNVFLKCIFPDIDHYRPNVNWSRLLPLLLHWLHPSLVGWGMGWSKPEKMHFSDFEGTMVKAANDDRRVNTIKSPQSNPDISNGQIHQFWGEDFEANIFGPLLQHLNLIGSSTNPERPGLLDKYLPWVIFFIWNIFSPANQIYKRNHACKYFFEMN